ncbi:hypothetical protein ACIQ6V_29280 [Streptomyces sp. NPDC096198]|uniref:hypothetical protein n=1 Tax=Streptomyces sp. NPDC096198 TaxID=3366080 RepID=UPI003817ED07
MKRKQSAPLAPVPAVEFLASQEITQTQCRQCGSEVAGVNGRYACGVCGWVNHWSEGHNDLPTTADDNSEV